MTTPMMNDAVGQLRFVRNVLRVAWFLAAAGILAMVVARNLPLSGELSASVRTAQPSGFVGGFTPLDRARPVQEGDVWYSDVVAEPVYFHVAAPRLYGDATVTLRYRNLGQPYLALGARTDPKAWSFDLRPIDLPMLDEAAGWTARQDGALRIYERRATSRSAAEILASPTGRTAVLGVDPAKWGMRLPKVSEKPVEASLALEGTRRLYVYVQDGALDVSLGFRGPADAEARVTLKKGEKTLLSRARRSDGAVDLALTGAEPGLYRIDVDAPPSMSLVGLRSRHARLMLSSDGGLEAPPGATAFEPEFPIFTWEADPATAPYDAIVADYRPPETDAEGWRTASTTFRLRDLAAAQGRVQLILSAPGIRARGATVRIDRVDVRYADPVFSLTKALELLKPKP